MTDPTDTTRKPMEGLAKWLAGEADWLRGSPDEEQVRRWASEVESLSTLTATGMAVTEWRDAYAKYLAASDRYNARLKDIREREAKFPETFGRDNPQAEYQALHDAQQAQFRLIPAMYAALAATQEKPPQDARGHAICGNVVLDIPDTGELATVQSGSTNKCAQDSSAAPAPREQKSEPCPGSAATGVPTNDAKSEREAILNMLDEFVPENGNAWGVVHDIRALIAARGAV